MNAEQLNVVADALGEETHTLMAEVDKRIKLLKSGGVEIVTSKQLKQSQDGPGVGTVLAGAALTGFLLALLARR